MGCCLSSFKLQENYPNNQDGLKAYKSHVKSPLTKSKTTHEFDFRAPLPVEEETVKEVLSETPVSKSLIPELVEERKTQTPVTLIQPKVENFETNGVINKAEDVSERSQISEICSVSGSFSTATTATTATLTDKREDEVTSKKSSREGSQRVNRSPANASRKRPHTANSGGARERRAKSSVRRNEPSREKKSLVSTRSSVRRRESGQLTTRKLGEVSGDSGGRSRSPSTRRLSGARGSKVNSGGSQLNVYEDVGRQLLVNGVEKVGEENDGVPYNALESLENPHVSLECFIFL